MLSCLSAGAIGRAAPRRATFSHYGARAISIFYQFIQFLGATAGGEVALSSSLLFIFLPIQQSTLRTNSCARLPAQLIVPARPPTSGSRCGRPVSAKPIGKQRPKIYFPVSFPSPMSKHSNRSRKSTMRPQFLLTMISLSSRRNVLRRENLTNLKIYDIIYLQGEGRKKNLHHHLHYA